MEADTSSDQRPVIPASEILAKIERGEDVEYDGVIVEGDLDVSGLDLPTEHVDRTELEVKDVLSDKQKVISSGITITNSEIWGKVNFGNSHFLKIISFWSVNFDKNTSFKKAEFSRGADFRGAKFAGRNVSFRGAKFCWETDFGRTKFGEYAEFVEAMFTDSGVVFVSAEFNGGASFAGAEFTGRYARFWETKFNRYANFVGAKFTGGCADFRKTEFDGGVDFEECQFARNVSFKDTKFGTLKSQEVAFRIAKRTREDLGDKKDADYYYYKEMEARRMQNGIEGMVKVYQTPPGTVREYLSQFKYKIAQILSRIKRFLIYDVLEYIFIQRIFGYGVRPFNIAKAWLIVVFALGIVYYIGSGVEKANNALEWYEYFYFSIVTAATPGYAGYTPASGLYTLIAGAEAIFGTFMWAAFIATFARKWQR